MKTISSSDVSLRGNEVLKPRLVDFQGLTVITGLSLAALRWHHRMGRIKCLRFGRRILFDHEEVLKDLKKASR